MLKEIYAINPNVKIIGSPWTAPQWMKVNADGTGSHYSWTGGTLGKDYYDDYAQYFVKWIQYMEAQGFDIYAVTPQNEPLNAGNSMSRRSGYENPCLRPQLQLRQRRFSERLSSEYLCRCQGI